MGFVIARMIRSLSDWDAVTGASVHFKELTGIDKAYLIQTP